MVRHLRPLLAPALAAATLLLAPAAPATAGPDRVPAAPVGVTAGNGTSSIGLTWQQPAEGPRPDHFRVYEGSVVVARNTTTSATVGSLGYGTTHTYQVAAVTARGVESPLSAPVTRSVSVSGAPPLCEPPRGPVIVGEVTPTAVSLSWRPGTNAHTVRIGVAGRQIVTDDTSIRVGGLTPGTGYEVTLAPVGCPGMPPPPGGPPPVRFTTPAGPGELPGQPTELRVTASTDTAIDLAWTAPAGGTPVASYAVFSGGTRIGTSSSPSFRLADLWRATGRPLTVAALTAAGAESVHSNRVYGSTDRCAPTTPAPTQLQATAVSPSSVELSWISTVQSSAFTVYDGDQVVAEARVPSARITGLASDSRHRYRVVTRPDGCPASPASRTARVRTPDGPPSRPAPPTALRAGSRFDPTLPAGHFSLTWVAPAGDPPAAGYRVYEGGVLIGASAEPSLTGLLPPATTHRVVVVSVDAAGNESVPSNAVDVTGMWFPPPAPPPAAG